MGRKLREGPGARVTPIPARRLKKRQLKQVSPEQDLPEQDFPEQEGDDSLDATDLVPMAEYICSCRRLRDEMFGVDFFGDPAWDILLDLYIGQSENRVMPGRKVSWNTTQRWKNVLEAEGLVYQQRDSDNLGGDISLTEKGTALMQDYLKRAARIV